MGKYSKAKMFNRKAAKSRSKPDRILETLSLKSGQQVVDIGSGGGYYSIGFAELVGKNGKVYAVDNNPDFLEYIKKIACEKELKNIETILVNDKDIMLPRKNIDLVFIRNVYHHLPDRVKYFQELHKKLKSDTKIAIIEYTRHGFFSFHRRFGHNVPKETIVEEMKNAGYVVEESFDFLPEQSFIIFSPTI
jgi:ubiquinone/menaquinone biosynthesis C-methylase UbiE